MRVGLYRKLRLRRLRVIEVSIYGSDLKGVVSRRQVLITGPQRSGRGTPVGVVSLQAVHIEHVAGMGGKTHALVLENHRLSHRGGADFL